MTYSSRLYRVSRELMLAGGPVTSASIASTLRMPVHEVEKRFVRLVDEGHARHVGNHHPYLWEWVGPPMAPTSMSERIIAVLSEQGPMPKAEICTALGVLPDNSTLNSALYRLEKRGSIHYTDGLWVPRVHLPEGASCALRPWCSAKPFFA